MDVRARIGPGVKLPPRAVVPYRAKIDTQADADRLFSARYGDLLSLARRLAEASPPVPPEAPPAPTRAARAVFE